MTLDNVCVDFLSLSQPEMETLIILRRNARRAIFLNRQAAAAAKSGGKKRAAAPSTSTLIKSMPADDRAKLISILEEMLNENKH